MSKMYTITEENYKEVLNRLQKICNKYRLLDKYEYFKISGKVRNKNENYGKAEYETKSWGYRTVVDHSGEAFGGFKTREEYCENSSFVHATEHNFKIKHDNDPESYDAKHWDTLKPLIALDVNPCEVIVLTYGDKVQFEKWGFIVYTDNSSMRFRNDKLTVYKHTFVIKRTEKITDLEAEIEKRDLEWKEDCEDYARIEREAEERARELGCYDEFSNSGDYTSDEYDDYILYGDDYDLYGDD